MTWGAIGVAGIGAASSLLGAKAGAGAAKLQKRLAKDQMAIAGTAYSPINVSGPGGGGITFGAGGTGSGGGTDYSVTGKGIKDLGGGFRKVGSYGLQSDIGNVNVSLGDLDPARQALVGAAGGLAGGLGLQGLSPLQSLGLGLAGQGAGGPQLDLGTLDALSGLFGGTTGSLFNQFNQQQQNPFQQQLMEQLYGGAQGQFADAARGFGDYRQSTLDLLRQEAAPQEQRAFSNLQNNLFATGRMGSSGGALQTEAFARGMGQADLTRQLQAGQEARAAQSQALGMGQGLAGQGGDIRSLQDQLLGNAFQRFGSSAEMAQGLSRDRYGRTLGASQFGVEAGAGLFGLGQQAQLNPYAIQAGALGNLESILGQTGQLQKQAYLPAEMAQAFMRNQAATRTGQATTMDIPSLSGPQTMNANMFSQLGGALLGSQTGQAGLGSAFGKLGGLFNRGPGQVNGIGGFGEAMSQFAPGQMDI